ncbi:DUF4435 domain-containing protein [Clostridium ljungdahlii]|uniref:ATPase AAA-type core domain-containing protein n=1 Tax=Clostridium ljungdahlii TaxID=1538 RepID=A0A162NB24_9CLOT|nr:AAA family ATPase [Clostridium ljungdahlii]OAA91239.1 hypothetical protein WY13_00804 [Clostridium ljungdahlii]
MEIKIPLLNGENQCIKDKQSVVLIGANGSGKTRMSVWIEKNNKQNFVHRISAQKSLNMPEKIQPSDLDISQEKLLYGVSNKDKNWLEQYAKYGNRWNNHPETNLLNDYSNLMEYLMTEEYQKSIEYRDKHKKGETSFNNETKLEMIKRLWEEILPHRKLIIDAGKIEVTKNNDDKDVYNGSEMSDGERAIFYFIGEVLSIPDNSIIIIDEPENHLHKSILVKLWNSIENYRTDCAFVYITHSLEFATSRINSQVLWIKEYNGNDSWNYELLSDEEMPESLMLEIMGNRQNILFVEGTKDKSIDIKLYSSLFKEYNVIPLQGGCQSVIQYTRAYNSLDKMHYLTVKGIIDKDRRNQEEIDKYKKENIFVLQVAEIENLFLLPEIVTYVLNKLAIDNCDNIISTMKSNVIKYLENHKEEQALLFTEEHVKNKINNVINNKALTIEEYEKNITSIESTLKVKDTYDLWINKIEEIIRKNDFYGALRITNNKGLLPSSGILSVLGWKKNYYIDYVLRLVDLNKQENDVIRNEFLKYINCEQKIVRQK